ncbi:tetratricopeptide repeat protein [Edaphobacter aggregans]|uniref:tetratricopeptide repeat protein n=1 Tax=Edaphobacter aggregans TaxID=570835 RepID=UPI0012F98358|nr:tetratricopeptide repeat protein [Edaphobacter aggregans]
MPSRGWKNKAGRLANRIHGTGATMRNSLSLILKDKVATTFLSLFIACPLLAQTTPDQRLAHAYALEREGKPAQAIVELHALLDEKSLDTQAVGKAWNVLGLAYEDQGDYLDSQHAYERSIRTLEGLSNNIEDYAMALDDFGGLYLEAGQLELAVRLRQKAFSLYEKISDHAGMTRASRNLAGIAFSRQKTTEGRRYLERAVTEAQLANDLDSDDLAAIASMQGWLAQLDGHREMSVSRYKQSLDLLLKRHGEEHPFVGWGYMLLGRAHADVGELTTALAEMSQGRAILGRTLDSQNPKYLTAEIAYSHVLDATGAHLEAARIRTNAERGLKEGFSHRCNNCTISAAAFQ